MIFNLVREIKQLFIAFTGSAEFGSVPNEALNQFEVSQTWQVISKLHEEFLTLKEEEVANSTFQPQNADQGSQKLFGKGNRLMILY